MNDYQRAAEAIDAELNRLKGLAEAAEVLKSVGSLEQAELEAKSRVDKLQADEQAAKDRVAGFDAEYAKKKADAKQAADQLHSEASKAVADADERAAKIVSDAEVKANKIVSAAQGKVSDLEARAQRLSDALRAVK